MSDGTNSAYSYLAKPALADHTCPVRCELRPPGSVLPNRLTGRASSASAAQSAGAAPFHEIFTTDFPDNTDNTVKVNGTNAYQKWEYFWEQVGTNNSNAPQWVGINVTATNKATVSGGIFLPQNPETNTYDLDGNLTSDGRWGYSWDAENRLCEMWSLNNAPPASPQYSSIFTYDYMGRRIITYVWTNDSESYVENRYVYDGWNVVAILDGSNNALYTCTWGTDMSGSMQGAGGVGGLLSITVCAGSNAGTYFCCYDGNGNIVALVNAANGSVAANYEYGPFGEVIRATGPMAKLNPFMFSTKFYDWETGLYYYGHRYYNPSTGRWLSRDPIEEEATQNLYVFTDNDPIDETDFLGLDPLAYTSIGVTHRQGSSTHDSDESGNQHSSSAWYWQWADEKNPCPGGLCNSGGDDEGSSHVDASVKNTGRCRVNVYCTCTLSWNGSTHSPVLPGVLPPHPRPGKTYEKKEGSFAVYGNILGTSFTTNSLPHKSTSGIEWDSFGSDRKSVTDTFYLAPGESHKLYHGYTVVVVHALSGAGWSEAMNGSCSCYVRNFSIQQ